MSIRQKLGDFCSISCFKYVILGVEDVLGADGASTVLIRAGRMRGEGVAKDAGLAGTNPPTEDIAATLNRYLGREGTCLCEVEGVTKDGETFVVMATETVCSAGELPNSQRNCTYTLGAIQGFLEGITGKQFHGKQVESVLRGGKADVLQFVPLN